MGDSKAVQDAISKSENYKMFASGLNNCMQRIFKLNFSSDINALKIIMKFFEGVVDSLAALEKLQEKKIQKEEPVIEPILDNIKVEKEDIEEMNDTEIDPNIALGFAEPNMVPIVAEQSITLGVAEQNIVPRVAEQNIIPRDAEQNIIPRDLRIVRSPTKASTKDNYQKLNTQTNHQNNTFRPNNDNYQQYQTTNKIGSAYDNRRTPYARNMQNNHRMSQQSFHQYYYPQHQQQFQQPDNMQQYQMHRMPYMNQQILRPTRYFPH